MTVEQRLNELETAVRRQRMILTVVGLVAIAAAPQSSDAEFKKVTARELFVENDAGLLQVG